MLYSQMNKAQLQSELSALLEKYSQYERMNLALDMSRGKPAPSQLDIANGLLDAVKSGDSFISGGFDTRNYGVLDGIAEAKELFSKMIDVEADEIFIGGNSSLNLMYDTIAKGLIFGMIDSKRPWCKEEKIKWLCPAPGYDRHFAICESFGIEMITVPMKADGPDMDIVEKLVAEDEAIKGIWCVPMYANPTGITYSDEVVKRFANMKTKAPDFKIFWDNAYCVHHLTDTPDKLLSILEECKKAGNKNRVFIFGSTSKVTFAGAGVAVMGMSKENLDYFKKFITIQTIGYDKINMLRHVRYLKNFEGMQEQMKKLGAQIAPKFEKVLEILESELTPCGIGQWHKPNGGYFISLDTPKNCAKRTFELCKKAGVVLTSAGATFPYGKDPDDKNLRIAPTYPPIEELELAAKLLCLCVKIAAVENLINA